MEQGSKHKIGGFSNLQWPDVGSSFLALNNPSFYNHSETEFFYELYLRMIKCFFDKHLKMVNVYQCFDTHLKMLIYSLK